MMQDVVMVGLPTINWLIKNQMVQKQRVNEWKFSSKWSFRIFLGGVSSKKGHEGVLIEFFERETRV